VKGYDYYEIANRLQIPRPTITKDVQYLRLQDQDNLQGHIQERLPQEYENCMTGINIYELVVTRLVPCLYLSNTSGVIHFITVQPDTIIKKHEFITAIIRKQNI